MSETLHTASRAGAGVPLPPAETAYAPAPNAVPTPAPNPAESGRPDPQGRRGRHGRQDKQGKRGKQGEQANQANQVKQADQGAQGKQRDAFFDNAKYLAIVLVAMGHAWEPLRADSRAAAALYIAVYTFHMPAFIIISGYFSRSFDASPNRLKRLVTGVAVPYVIFEVVYSLFKRVANDDPTHPISLLDPWYLVWFLGALFIWRLTTPLWKLVRWPLPLALAIAVLASVSPDIG
ncbi:acyltransferase family protein, partial [Streptomyces cavernicola]